MKLDLLQLPDVPAGTPVDHGLASGRIAFACDLVPPIHAAAAAASIGSIITPPLTLPTPGKADVVVTILGDPDGYEICYVEAVAFYQLAEPKYDVIDFASRATRGGMFVSILGEMDWLALLAVGDKSRGVDACVLSTQE